MNRLIIGALAALSSVSLFGAAYTIHAPGGVGDVVALTNALQTLTSSYSEFRLEPGVYDLKGIAMSDTSHLVMQAARRLIGLGEKPDDTILLGGGVGSHKRILEMKCFNDYYTVISNVTLTGGYIDGTNDGGAIYGGRTALIGNCILSNNVCGGSWQGGGGAIFKGRAEHCLFVDNRGMGDKIEGTPGSGGCHAGGIWCNTEHHVNDGEDWQGAYDCVFTNCYTRSEGGGARGGTFVRCKFYDCNANFGGGTAGGRLIDCDFIGNVVRDGKAAGAYNPTCVSNCVFKKNYTMYEHSGALWTKGDVPVIGCLFEGNSANREGGGMCCRGGLISNCVFRCNVSRTDGGGAGLFAPDRDVAELLPTFKVVDCVFEGNVSPVQGGGAIAPGGFVNCTFLTNVCKTGGGGVYCRTASPCGGFVGCKFIGNRVTDWAHGGGVLSSDDANRTTLVDCYLATNTAGAYAAAAARANLLGCTITNHVSGTYVTLNCNMDGCVFVDNCCATAGGVSCDTWRSDFGGNVAYTNVNCIFRGNKTDLRCVVDNKVNVNCSFIGSVCGSNYGRVINQNDFAFNCVFLDNKCGGTLTDFNYGLDKMELPHLTNCSYSNDPKHDPTTSDRCTGCFRASASELRFAKTHADDRPYEPRHSSPLVDKGYEADWLLAAVGAKDVYGNPRVMFDHLDIGPAECQEMGPGFLLLLR